MKISAHLLHAPEPASLSYLQEHLEPDVTITTGPDLPEPAGYHILVAGRPQREHLVASPNLKALVIPWAGLPASTRELALTFPHIAVHNLHHNSRAVAEMTMALLLSAAKFIVPMDRALRACDWRPRYGLNPAVMLEAKTAVILGYGAIGQRVAKLCRALGMHVLATRRTVDALRSEEGAWRPALVDGEIEVYPPAALAALLPQAHALIICLPLTSETEGLIGAQELAQLPSRAVLVNVGRGAIVDEQALYEALRDGVLHAAGLDVWYNYPQDEAARIHTPPSAYPIYELDNVVLSPHRSGTPRLEAVEQERMRALATLLNAAARGEPLPNRVDVQVGY